jgi:hypothetical protein
MTDHLQQARRDEMEGRFRDALTIPEVCPRNKCYAPNNRELGEFGLELLAQLEQAQRERERLEEALRLADDTILAMADQQAMPDDWFQAPRKVIADALAPDKQEPVT